ncbi:hypothetical protein N9595_01015 [Bacteroidia bacterium]|nr:hypothetical protein [Bacteroidia bacterium]
MKLTIRRLKIGTVALFTVIVLGSFTVSVHLNHKNVLADNLLTKNDPGEDYDEGYEEGYCEGFRDGYGDKYFNCPPAPYIDNNVYNQGCENYYKCGYNAGFKHGYKDGKGYR